jgi:hypothetical protein
MAAPDNSFMREITRRASKARASFDWARFFLLFSMACAVGLFVIAVKMTQSREASSRKEVQVTNPASVSQSAEKPRSQAAHSKKKANHSRNKGSERGGIRVKDDSTVFQSNSADSAQVKSLKKGDEVRSGGLEIIDPQGSWTLIQKSGRSGFVPSEMLQRESPTSQAKQ